MSNYVPKNKFSQQNKLNNEQMKKFFDSISGESQYDMIQRDDTLDSKKQIANMESGDNNITQRELVHSNNNGHKMKSNKRVAHKEILSRLLQQIEPVDFRSYANVE